MLRLLESKREIERALRQLRPALRPVFSRSKVKNIGYRSGREEGARVITNGQFWHWSSDHYEAATPRKLNWFGRDGEQVGTSISLEVNVAYEGNGGRAAGFFAHDNKSNQTFLMHSGRIGGGLKGVGKKEFCVWLNEIPLEAADGRGEIRDGFIVMPLEGEAAGLSAVRYLKKVDEFKSAVRSGEIENPSFKERRQLFNKFFSEPNGKRKRRAVKQMEYVTRHGEIVDALCDWRQARPMFKGMNVVKDFLIDMGVARGPHLSEVYEVKTSTDRQAIYTALGQLLVHGGGRGCQKVLVLPSDEDVADDLVVAIRHLHISTLRFSFDRSNAVIIDDSKL